MQKLHSGAPALAAPRGGRTFAVLAGRTARAQEGGNARMGFLVTKTPAQEGRFAMADNIITATGPLFGPDFVEVVANDDTGLQYTVQVYPDASNRELKAAGLPTQYYWQPARVYLAKKQNSPKDYAFGMTVFKGLLTGETTVGIDDTMTTGGTVETGGGFCTFTTTFALPDSVITNVIKALKAGEHAPPVPRLEHLFFQFASSDPDPLLGIIPILESNVTIEIPDTGVAAGATKAPLHMSAQGTGKGSIEAHGFNSFLVTCNELAAGAIAGSLKEGVSPFTVHCDLKELAYIHGCQVTVTVDVDKTYDQFSAALSTGGFLGIDSASLDYAWANMQTSGAITTHMQMDDGNLTPELKQWIEKNVDDIRKTAMDAVKNEIFDWKPTEQSPASTDRGFFSGLFGGSSVSLKASHQRHGVKLDQQLVLDTTIAVHSTISGELDDLMPAVKADLDKYLAIVDIGEFFKKVQVAATSAINFDEVLPDGTSLHDPIQSVQLEVSYPDYSHPGDDQAPNLVTQAQGFHYTIGNKDPNKGAELAVWTKDNPTDVVNVSFLRLDKPPKSWPANQVKLRKTVVFDGSDPRVELRDGGSTVTVETVGEEHAPKLTADEVGYVFVRFIVDQVLPPNVTVTVKATIGERTDTITLTQANQKNGLWEIYSDKYADETEFTYTAEVEVVGANFTDEPIDYATPAPVTVPLPTGRLKYVNPLKVTLPAPPADKVAAINEYIKAVVMAATPPPQFEAPPLPPAPAPVA